MEKVRPRCTSTYYNWHIMEGNNDQQQYQQMLTDVQEYKVFLMTSAVDVALFAAEGCAAERCSGRSA